MIVRTSGQFEDLEDVRDTVIRANDLGSSIRVKDVAKVYYDLEKTSLASRTNGKPSIALKVLKKEKFDAIRLVDQVNERIERLKTFFF